MAHGNGGMVMVDEERWRQVQHGRKSRRQRAWLSQPVEGNAVGYKPAQSGVRRQLPSWLRQSNEPSTPPWRSGGRGGGKTKSEGKSGNGVPWPFQGGAAKPVQDDKIPCGNPQCPGFAGKQSFKFKNSIGRGLHGWHCMACRLPWETSWDIYFNGRPPPSKWPQWGGEHNEEDEPDLGDDEFEITLLSASGPAYQALDETYRLILGKILELPDENQMQLAMDHFKNHENQEVGKAMLAAFTEAMGKRQAAAIPILRHPAGDLAADLAALRKDRNKADQLARQSAALVQRKKLEVLDLQERLAQAQKEQAEAVALNEEHCKELALKDQHMQAAMANRERLLLQEAGTPTVPTVALPQQLQGLCQNAGQAQQLAHALSLLFGKFVEANGGSVDKAMETLGTLVTPAQATQSKPDERPAPPTPPTPEAVLRPPATELNEVSMSAGKRKPGDDGGEADDAEEQAAASLLGEDASGAKKDKKTKVGDKAFSPTLAQTIKDTEVINRLIDKNLRGPDGAASASTGQQQG